MIDTPQNDYNVSTEARDLPYPLDQGQFLIEIEANGKTLAHTLRQPTLDDLTTRENLVVYETEEIADGQDAVRADTERADAALWDRIAVSVRGYRTATHSPEDTIEVTPEIAAKIPTAHKATAIRGLYTSTCEVEQSEDEGFNLDGELFTVRQELGKGETPDFIVRHILRQPTEGERQEYRRKAAQTVLVRGAKRTKARVQTNLKASVDLYDKCFVELSGAFTPETDRAKILRQIDAMWKRQVIVALMQSFESSLSD